MPNVKTMPELMLERALFASRWLMAPFYIGMVAALAAVLYVFLHELIGEMSHLTSMDAEQVILLSLSLIDLSLAGNLLLIVILSGYENFVSRIEVADHQDRPSWMGTVDFSGLKMKLIASSGDQRHRAVAGLPTPRRPPGKDRYGAPEMDGHHPSELRHFGRAARGDGLDRLEDRASLGS